MRYLSLGKKEKETKKQQTSVAPRKNGKQRNFVVCWYIDVLRVVVGLCKNNLLRLSCGVECCSCLFKVCQLVLLTISLIRSAASELTPPEEVWAMF